MILNYFNKRKDGFISICYHLVSDQSLAHVKYLHAYKTSEEFEADLKYLSSRYEFLSYEQLEAHRISGVSIKPNSIFLSFDDGYEQCYSVVRPILLNMGIPATFFISTDFIDNKKMFYRNKVSLCVEKIGSLGNTALKATFFEINRFSGELFQDKHLLIRWLLNRTIKDIEIIDRVCLILEIDIDQYLLFHKPYLTTDQIKCLLSEGFTLGAHSRGHPKFNLLSYGDMEKEIVESCKVIMGLSSQKRIPFAFPFSGNGLNEQFLRKLIAKYEYIGLFFKAKDGRSSTNAVIDRVWLDVLSLENILKKLERY